MSPAGLSIDTPSQTICSIRRPLHPREAGRVTIVNIFAEKSWEMGYSGGGEYSVFRPAAAPSPTDVALPLPGELRHSQGRRPAHLHAHSLGT